MGSVHLYQLLKSGNVDNLESVIDRYYVDMYIPLKNVYEEWKIKYKF